MVSKKKTTFDNTRENKPQSSQPLLETDSISTTGIVSVSEKQNAEHHREDPCQETFSHLRQLHLTP